ncbi:hypothetical protein HNR65_003535 [Desulfosalsimonas propionicica]|uniref:Sacsin/Nov domain-containing protein n=1 Tax=Desulfosalsimonas propionicica TaxID=332175 RepID=A0A7W0HM93_9BACT|nr:hypothetical protein [Desulfosalsimonas propionicica]MBA2883174.1 hypothetical protein [Desulfosalsimonas propionicica]
MKKYTHQTYKTFHGIEPRPNSCIVRSPLDEVKTIRSLLEDVYKDAGDGRTLLRELVQNADDAEASELVFAVLEDGWQEASNSLLKGPALIVANNGPFSAQDHEALHKALGGSKTEQTDKIGRFGIGLKSVFHICEAIVYLGAEKGVLRPGVVNPWAGTGGTDERDPIHPDWDFVEGEDLDKLIGVADLLLGNFHQGLIEWIPLRNSGHLDRAKDITYGLGAHCFQAKEITAWFSSSDSLGLLLSQCGHLTSIEAICAKTPENLESPKQEAHISRPDFQALDWIGRYNDDSVGKERFFEGQIQNEERSRSVLGVEALGHSRLRELRNSPGWPTEQEWRQGRCDWVPRKALGHAAITILRPTGAYSEPSELRIRWAVFLPLDEDPQPETSDIVEVKPVGKNPDSGYWDLVLHGYFWPSQDRRSIPGVTTQEQASGESAMREKWNRALRDELLLPLLPNILARMARDMPEDTTRSVLIATLSSQIVQQNIDAVTKTQFLLPIICKNGVAWKTFPVNGIQILSIPHWHHAPDTVRMSFVNQIKEHPCNYVFIENDAPQLGDVPGKWPYQWIQHLLSCISGQALRTSQGLSWTASLLRHIIGDPNESGHQRTHAVARWLSSKIAEKALRSTSKGSNEEQQPVREIWVEVFNVLPNEWLISAPLGALKAVEELAENGIIGPGFFPVPLGRNPEMAGESHPDAQSIDKALLDIARRMMEDSQSSQRARNSRLMLAEVLIALRGINDIDPELNKLPLLRARRLPKDIDDAWSIYDLKRQMEKHRVFAKQASEISEDQEITDLPSDPRKAGTELAEALGVDIWLINKAVGMAANLPYPVEQELAVTVKSTESVNKDPEKRKALLKRIAGSEYKSDPIIYNAIFALLTGSTKASQERQRLFYVRSQHSDKINNNKTLNILLRLLQEQWRAIEASLIEPLPHALVQELQVTAIDFGVLHELLAESLDSLVEWSELHKEDAIHLLRHLHSASSENRLRWKRMPLHRMRGGSRGAFKEGVLRAVSDINLPEELESEILLLDPDPEVVDLYFDVPVLDENGILKAMLTSHKPHRFAGEIVSALRNESENLVFLPSDSSLRDLLKRASWLPLCGHNSGIAPEKLLLLPNEKLQGLIAPIEEKGALDDFKLIYNIAPSVWNISHDLVFEILGRPSPSKQILKLASAIESSKIENVDGGFYALLPETDGLDIDLIIDIFQTPLCDAHKGWFIVRTAAEVINLSGGQALTNAPGRSKEAILALVKSLCSKVPPDNQIYTLRSLAESRPRRDDPAGRVHRKFIEVFSQTETFFEKVLPSIEMPTQDGQWRLPREIAMSESGISRRHRLLSDYRSLLGLDRDEPWTTQRQTEHTPASGSVDTLRQYFSHWSNRVPKGAVGSFLSLLGNGHQDGILELAQEWLGDDVSVEGMRAPIEGETDIGKSIKIRVSGIATGQRVRVMNLLGQEIEMELGAENEMIFATDPELRRSALGRYWIIILRDPKPEHRTQQELLELLGNSVEWWAKRVLNIEIQQVRQWWTKWGTGSQAYIGPVQASILAHLPQTFYQLDVRECAELRDALKNAQRAQRRREQAPSAQLNKAIRDERSALEKLGSLVRNEPEYQKFIWYRMQELMKRFGYTESSVLLELSQNADDALAQSAEISGTDLPAEVQCLFIRVNRYDDKPEIEIKHYGRPINETGGTGFPAGPERQWDQDLYFMMLLNLSGKPGETPGQSSSSSTTGRFGLGFKSVHLVSEMPSVISGFLAFTIKGGILPVEQALPEETDRQPINGHPPTIIKLPLREDLDESELLNGIFKNFHYARAFLPAFSRQIRKVVIEGGPRPGISTFEGQQIDGAPGWSLAKDPVTLPETDGRWRILRFCPREAGNSKGTEAVIIGLKHDRPKALPMDMPFLWNVTPTSESWGCGYAVNGPFKLDPGRAHVALEDEKTRRVFDLLGETLGKSLLNLHDALENRKDNPLNGPPKGNESIEFLSALWKILASGIDNRDQLRKELLLSLHGDGRGISGWMRARSIVPSGLPEPFLPRLPVLNDNTQVEMASEGLDSPAICRAISQIDDITAIARSHVVASEEIVQLLQPFLSAAVKEFSPADLFHELAESWNYTLTPERHHGLRPLAEGVIWEQIQESATGQPWYSKLNARSLDGNFSPLRKLLLPPTAIQVETEAVDQDEFLRAAFAPQYSILDPEYIVCREDLEIFLRLRARHEIDAAVMASWYTNLTGDHRHEALKYLLDGRLQKEILEKLIPHHSRPVWLSEYEQVRSMLAALNREDHWQSRQLLAALFPTRFQEIPEEIPEGRTLPEANRLTFFERFRLWWNDPHNRDRVIDAYETKAWPDWLRHHGISYGLQNDSKDHWLALFVLGACRSLGLTQRSHHRNFAEFIKREGWWEIFKNPDETTAWMDLLRIWQDRSQEKLEYLRWMSLFPAIYQLSRHLETYKRLIRSAERRPAELYRVSCLLAPRVDEALTGAGQQFDAPPAPLNFGLHWILRELVRMNILEGNHLLPDCWVPSDQIVRFLCPLGLETIDSGVPNRDKAKAIYDFLKSELDTATPNLHKAFDIPFCYIAENHQLQQELGLEV